MGANASSAAMPAKSAQARGDDSSGLAAKHCVPCEGGTPPLDARSVESYLRQVQGWTVTDGGKKIAKSFRFDNFVQAVDFVNAITPVAEAEGHHPDLVVRWGEVRVELWTHAAGGLTENDFILAAKIDQIRR
jgi:4a-hydroxytetrahydrobiopterin dehydratase